MDIDLDFIDGATATDHITNGTSVERTGIVYVVPGGDTGTLFQNAIDFVYSTVGGKGTACPAITAPNYLEQVVPVAADTDTVKVRLVYKGLQALQVELGTCLDTVDSNTDKDGTPIEVQYTYPDDYLLDPRKAGLTIKQGGFIQKRVQETTMSFKYVLFGTEGETASSLLLNFSQSYVGLVSASEWSSAPGAARTWLCESVRGTSRDAGRSYEVTTSFHYREETWDFLVVFVNPDDGKPPNDLIEGVGYKKIEGYDTGTLPDMPPA